MAHQNLKKNWENYIYERKFNWALMKEISEQCHLYDPEHAYLSFKDYASRNKGMVAKVSDSHDFGYKR